MRISLWVLLGLFMSSTAFAVTKESYVKKANQELQEWNSKVDDLQKQSQKAGTRTRVELDQALKTVQANLDVFRQKVSELNGSGETGWKSLRRGADSAFKDVQHAYREATSFLDKGNNKEKP